MKKIKSILLFFTIRKKKKPSLEQYMDKDVLRKFIQSGRFTDSGQKQENKLFYIGCISRKTPLLS